MSESTDASRALALVPSPPRQLRRGVPIGIWIGRVFTLPHTIAGLVMPFVAIGWLLWGAFGVAVPAEVTGGSCYSTKNGRSCTLNYRYRYDDRQYRDRATISEKDFFRIGPTPAGEGRNRDLEALHFSLGPWVKSGLIGYSSRLQGLLLLIFAIVWDVFVAFILHFLWVKPARERALCETGAVAAGKVISQRVVRGGKGGPRQYATYVFQDELGAQHEREMQLWNGSPTVEIGQPVTVFYSRELPQRSYAYELGGFWIEQMPDPRAR